LFDPTGSRNDINYEVQYKTKKNNKN
jgi:hypothetical protein